MDVFDPRPETVPEPDVLVKVTGEAAAVRFPVASRSSTVKILAAPEASGLSALVKWMAEAVPATTENDDEAEASPVADALMVTGPTVVPVTLIDAIPPDVAEVPRPETEPLPADRVKEIMRPESLATRLLFASSTRTVSVSVPPATRFVNADEKCRWCAASAWNVTVAVDEIALPPIVPLTVAVPGDVGAVSVAA